jgi:hypothetical protein
MDLFADLVDEDQAGIRFRNRAGEFPHGLRHEAGLHTHVRIAHFAIEFGFGDERSDGIHHQHIDRAGGAERGGDFESLFGVIGLRDKQIIHVDA